jgi:hypothetical protein
VNADGIQYRGILLVCCMAVVFIIQCLVPIQDCVQFTAFCYNSAFLCCDKELESMRWAGFSDMG